MRLTIFQIVPELDENRVIFMDLDFVLKRCSGRIPAESYRAVFDGELEIGSLEDAFYIFNMQHLAGYKGRSMSVSDVVEVQTLDDGPTFHYCCSVGFREVDFDKDKAQLPAQKGEDDGKTGTEL